MSRVVAGTLLLPNGQPMANASIYFTAKRTEPVSIIEGSNTFFNTNAAGVYNQSVVNGFYAVSIQYIADASGAHTRRWQLGDVFIEDGATTTLEALIIASNVPDDIALGVFYQILEEAQQAATDAQAAADAAAASAASISVGTGLTQIPNNTILNTRLGTSGNLGTAAQRAIGTGGTGVSDNTQLNTRLGTAGNLGTAAQKTIGTGTSDVSDNAQLNTRLGTAGNLGTAAQRTVGTAGANISDNTQLNVRLNTSGNLGSLAAQNANAVAVTGGSVTGLSGLESSGINVGNTSNANNNVLDWYEEGAFTPTVVGHLTPGVGTYSFQQGKYTRIGNTITIAIRISWTAHTGTGNLQLSGLPFTSGPQPRLSLQIYSNSLVIGAGRQLSNLVEPVSTLISLLTMDLAGGASSNLAMDTAVTELVLSGTYFV